MCVVHCPFGHFLGLAEKKLPEKSREICAKRGFFRINILRDEFKEACSSHENTDFYRQRRRSGDAL